MRKWADADEEAARLRFTMELEFVQCLSNPIYLRHLAQTRTLSTPAFVKYLEYLQYWKRPEYVKYLVYPYCLFFLDMLQKEEFRTRLLMDPSFAETLLRQEENHWRFYRYNRLIKRE